MTAILVIAAFASSRPCIRSRGLRAGREGKARGGSWQSFVEDRDHIEETKDAISARTYDQFRCACAPRIDRGRAKRTEKFGYFARIETADQEIPPKRPRGSAAGKDENIERAVTGADVRADLPFGTG
jgi:hypothetical protein